MDVVRRISLLVTACLLGIAVMLGAVMSRPAMSANVAKELAAATSFLIRQSRSRAFRGHRDRAAISLPSPSVISSGCDWGSAAHFVSPTKRSPIRV